MATQIHCLFCFIQTAVRGPQYSTSLPLQALAEAMVRLEGHEKTYIQQSRQWECGNPEGIPTLTYFYLLSGQGCSLRYTKQSRQSTSIGSSVSTSMSEKDQYKNRIELLQGTLDMLILQTLQWGPQHGYGIVQALRLRSGDVLQVETGSLYPALHRLERQSWVQSEWKQSESKQKARYYRITAKGKKQLASDLGRWERIVEAIGSVMYVKPKESES